MKYDLFKTSLLNDVEINISFPHCYCTSIIEKELHYHTINEILGLRKGDSIKFDFDENWNEGTLYSAQIDNILCNLDNGFLNKHNIFYPSVKFFSNKEFKDTSIVLTSKNINIYIKGIDDKIYNLLEFIDKTPITLNKVILFLKGDFEYFHIN